MRRPTSIAAACLAATTLLLGGCTGSGEPASATTSLPAIDEAADAAALATVEVTAEPGEPPTVTFAKPLTLTGPSARVLQPGDGDAIEASDAVVVNLVTINGKDGSEEGNTYGGPPQLLVADEAGMPLPLLETMVGANVGARVLLAGPADDQTTRLWVFEVESVLDVPLAAEGALVEPEPGLPTVGYLDSGTTEGRMPMTLPAVGPPPTELVVQTLVRGEGAEVTEDSRLVVQAVGALWDGTQFQNTWENGSGTAIVLSGAMRGWREGLVGQTIGSQVMLVVPPEWGYGDEGRGEVIPAGSTMVFVIDILAGI